MPVADIDRHYGRVDGLVNNAGRSYAAAIEEIDPALFDEIFHLNVLGPIVAMQSVIPIFRRQGEFVAEIVVTAIEDGGAQYFANDRLRQLAGA